MIERVVPERALEAIFRALQSRAHAAGAPHHDAAYRFAGRDVRVRVAGAGLAAALPRSFSHLRRSQAGTAPPGLDIHVWDPDAPGAPAVTFDEVDDPDGLTQIADSGRFLQQQRQGSLVSLDRARGVLVGALRATALEGDVYQMGKPFARLLAEWYADQGAGIMHAGLVASHGRAVLLAGRGGSGKSTTALACARAGFDFLGEDYAALEFRDDDSIVGYSVYHSAFIEPGGAAARIPDVARHAIASRTAAEPKGVLFVNDVWPGCARASARIAGLALCRVGSIDECRVRPASRSEALLGAAPSSLLQVHGRRRDSLDRLARLVERVPAVHLDLAGNPADAAAALSRFLATAVRS